MAPRYYHIYNGPRPRDQSRYHFRRSCWYQCLTILDTFHPCSIICALFVWLNGTRLMFSLLTSLEIFTICNIKPEFIPGRPKLCISDLGLWRGSWYGFLGHLWRTRARRFIAHFRSQRLLSRYPKMARIPFPIRFNLDWQALVSLLNRDRRERRKEMMVRS